jgi:hypothetical protein
LWTVGCTGGIPAGGTAETADTGAASADTGTDSGTGPDSGTVAIAPCDDPGDVGVVTVDGLASYTDLQVALDAASEGSTVVVCPGEWVDTYVARVAVHLVSMGGAAAVVLDGGGAGTTLVVQPGSTVTGLAITGGAGSFGGGLAVSRPGDVVVEDCIITGNEATEGGGVWVHVGTARFPGTVIHDNQAERGGGLFAAPAAVVDLADAVVSGNLAEDGGGVYLRTGTLTGGKVSANTSTSTGFDAVGGGGIALIGSGTLEGVLVAENLAAESGGGVSLMGESSSWSMSLWSTTRRMLAADSTRTTLT